jgi:tetratricopeptide (TPR) repeat protein
LPPSAQAATTRRGEQVVARVAVLLCALLGACAGGPHFVTHPPEFLFQDDSFVAPRERFSGVDPFAVSDAMRQYLWVDIASQLRSTGSAQGLVTALYTKGQLSLEYDASSTRTAAEAFDARAGNCLSLVIMTAALAKELDLSVEYHSAKTEEIWSRSGDLLLGSGHVNVELGYKRVVGQHGFNFKVYGRSSMLVDFLPADEIRGLPVREIPEDTIVAMFFNNRAVEALARGELDEAYGWAREAIWRSPQFENSYNTLAVVYLHHGDPQQASRVFRYALERAPENATVLSNLADTLDQMGDHEGAVALRFRLARIDPDPPYYFFNLGVEAMQRHDFESARSLFAKEVRRADYNHEFHYWLGVAYFKLGQFDRARRQLLLAIERTQSRGDHELYAAKLAWLQANAHGSNLSPAQKAPAH